MNEQIENTQAAVKEKTGKYISGTLACAIPLVIYWIYVFTISLLAGFIFSFLLSAQIVDYETYGIISNVYSIVVTVINLTFTVGYLALMIFPFSIAKKSQALSLEKNKVGLLVSAVIALSYGIVSVFGIAFSIIINLIFSFADAYASSALLNTITTLLNALPHVSITVGIFFLVLMLAKLIQACKHNKTIKNQF